MPKELRKHAEKIFLEALRSANVSELAKSKLRLENNSLHFLDHSWNLNNYEAVHVWSVGKAGCEFAESFPVGSGLVITKEGYGKPVDGFKVIESSHPVLDERSLNSGKILWEFLSHTNKDDLVIGLISGGASALVEVLPKKVSLADMRQLFDELLRSGASIHEINCVRKHISEVKGGKILEAIRGTSVNFILSDVIGNDLSVVSSGMTVADPTTFADAVSILNRFCLWKDLPKSTKDHFLLGEQGEIKETLKELPVRVENYLFGSNIDLLENSRKVANGLGYDAKVVSSTLSLDIHDAVKEIVNHVGNNMEKSSEAFIWGGEITLKVSGSGKGGRNQEFSLRLSRELLKLRNDILVLCSGTDGTDGPTDASGGIVDKFTFETAKEKNLNPDHYLDFNNSYPFLKATESLLITGPTGNNVMDFYLVIYRENGV